MSKERIASLGSSIVQNLRTEAQAGNKAKWDRGMLYLEARQFFASDKLFGQWAQSYSEVDFGVEIDTSAVRGKLMMCCRLLSEDQFLEMGTGKAFELAKKNLWDRFPDQAQYLVSVAHAHGQRALRDMVKRVMAGERFVEPPPPELTLAEQVVQLTALLSVERGKYRFSEDEFFSPDPVVQARQLELLPHGNDYAQFFFGIADINVATPEEINETYRTLSRKYHPDRKGGSDVLMAAVNEVRESLLSIVDSLRQMREIKERNAERDNLRSQFAEMQAAARRS